MERVLFVFVTATNMQISLAHKLVSDESLALSSVLFNSKLSAQVLKLSTKVLFNSKLSAQLRLLPQSLHMPHEYD